MRENVRIGGLCCHNFNILLELDRQVERISDQEATGYVNFNQGLNIIGFSIEMALLVKLLIQFQARSGCQSSEIST